MLPTNETKNNARLRGGLILPLIGLIAATTFILSTRRVASAQTVYPSWNYTGNLNAHHQGHTATLLQNGKVLIAGGTSTFPDPGGVPILRTELYDPATGTWSVTGNLNLGRTGHTATLLSNGKVLIAGGQTFTDTTRVTNSAELFDPATGTWSSTGSLNTARVNHTATVLPNGKVLIVGGSTNSIYNDSGAELYDPTTGTWSITGSLERGRIRHTATLLPNGSVLVAGGFANEIEGNGTTASAELYDPATGTWNFTGRLYTFRELHGATLLRNGKVLVVGGDEYADSGKSAELYDPATGTWSLTGSLNVNHNADIITPILLPSGKVLLAGIGYDNDDFAFQAAELYDPTTGSWSATTNPNHFHFGGTDTLLPNGQVLKAGGDGGTVFSGNTAELYDPGSVSGPNQIDDPESFVRQHYRDFLNREADPNGLNFWTGEIFMCGNDRGCIEAKRVNVSGAFYLSIEFQQSGYLVYRFYKSAFGNLPGAPVPVRLSDFLPDAQTIGQGVIVNQGNWQQQLEINKQNYAAAFVQRSAFASAYPTSMTPDAFVDTLFSNAGVTPASSDRSAAIAEFGSASNTADVAARARALHRVADNGTLVQQEFNRAFVLMQYFGYLRRNPNDAPDENFNGYNFWLDKLNKFNGDFVGSEMVRAFLVSTEYRRRFGP